MIRTFWLFFTWGPPFVHWMAMEVFVSKNAEQYEELNRRGLNKCRVS